MKNCEKQDLLMNSEVEAYCKKLKKVSSAFYCSRKEYITFKLTWYLLILVEKIFRPDYTILKYNLKCVEFIRDILVPLNNTLETIIEYKNFNFCFNVLKKNLPDSLKCDSTMEDIYNILRQTPKSKTQKLLREISPDLPSSEYLVHLLYISDKENFIKTLLNGNYNLQKIKEFCDIYGFKLQALKKLYKISEKREDQEMSFFESERIINEHIKNGNSDGLIRILNQLIKSDNSKIKISIKDIYSVTKCILYLYFILMKEYTSYEKKILDKIIKRIKRNPYYKKVYDKIYSIYQKEMAEYINDPDAPSILEILSKELSETDNETPQKINSIEILETCSGLPQEITSDKASETDDENNNEGFFLDKNYFNQQPVPDQNAYFCKLKEYVKAGEGTKFMEFINWLAKEGYIENTPETKATFAFRLTGICPPENLVEKIEWKKGVNEMAYIIRYFYPQTTKWSKIKIFFTSSLQNFDQQTSSYADNVDPTFEKNILEFYPNIKKN